MSSYRLGRYAEAITWAEKPLDSSPPDAVVQARAVLSMANWRLGRAAEARSLLAKGEALASDVALERGVNKFGRWWIDWPITLIMLDEAKALIQSHSTGQGLDKP